MDYANIFRGGGIAQVVTSPSGEFLDCNEMFSEMSGFKRSEITSYTMFHLTAPSQLPSLYQYVALRALTLCCVYCTCTGGPSSARAGPPPLRRAGLLTLRA